MSTSWYWNRGDERRCWIKDGKEEAVLSSSDPFLVVEGLGQPGAAASATRSASTFRLPHTSLSAVTRCHLVTFVSVSSHDEVDEERV